MYLFNLLRHSPRLRAVWWLFRLRFANVDFAFSLFLHTGCFWLCRNSRLFRIFCDFFDSNRPHATMAIEPEAETRGNWSAHGYYNSPQLQPLTRFPSIFFSFFWSKNLIKKFQTSNPGKGRRAGRRVWKTDGRRARRSKFWVGLGPSRGFAFSFLFSK